MVRPEIEDSRHLHFLNTSRAIIQLFVTKQQAYKLAAENRRKPDSTNSPDQQTLFQPHAASGQ
jgi:hypothetical protein